MHLQVIFISFIWAKLSYLVENDIVFDVRQAGPSISQTADRLGFSHTSTLKVCTLWFGKKDLSGELQFSGAKCLVDVKGQRRMSRLRWRRDSSNWNNRSLQQRYVKAISECPTNEHEGWCTSTAEYLILCHCCQLRLQNWSCDLELTWKLN